MSINDARWILQMSIQELGRLMEFLDYSELDVLNQPALLVFTTDDSELSIHGFKTLEEAKKFMEEEHDPVEGYYLESAYFEGKEMDWTEVKRFEFREKKNGRAQTTDSLEENPA